MASEKTETQTRTTASIVLDPEINIKDETGSWATRALTSTSADDAASRKVLRKIDMRILPLLCISYALQFMDKASLSYASVYGIIQDNKLQGQQYSWASSIFYFGYLGAAYPGIAIAHRFRLAKFLGINLTLWGVVLMATTACSSFAGLATARFMLGVVEAPIGPGFVIMMGLWWSRQEQASRSAIYISAVGSGGFLGALIVYGVAHIQGTLTSWKYIFLVLGGFTFIWGIFFTIYMPDGPASAKWLDEDEKIIAVQRVIDNKSGTRSRRFVKAQVIEAATDPKIIIMGLIAIVNSLPSGGLAFGSLLIEGFGFDPLRTTLMNLPMFAIEIVCQLGAGLLFARIPNSRLHIGSLALVPPIIGTVLMNQLQPANKWGRLAGYWLLGTYPVGLIVILNQLSTNIAGSTKKSVATGWVYICFSVGQIVGPQFFKSSEAPGYRSGIVSLLCSLILNLVFNQVLRVLYVLENRKRRKALEGKSEDELIEMKKESELQGFEDVTDGHNAMFFYAL
ncbi:MFS general substrate transporter [Jackrogersella minutella]|nr:MFS general substrate transporter [Jackrogersella minutella]